MEGSQVGRFFADREKGRYDYHQEDAHILMKVETHNHPTAISPGRVLRPAPAVKSAMKGNRSRRETESRSGRFLGL